MKDGAGKGGICYDHRRQNWRVAVTVDGKRIYRRASSYAEADEIRKELLRLRDRTALWRVRVERRRAYVDLSGLNDDQVNAVLRLIESFKTPHTTNKA